MPSRSADSKSRGSRPQCLDPASVHQFVEDLVGEDLHAKRVLSLANGVVGVLHGATLAIHAIGEGIAAATGVNAKHAIKQVDRMLIFLSPAEVASLWSALPRHLGNTRAMWAWLLGLPELPWPPPEARHA